MAEGSGFFKGRRRPGEAARGSWPPRGKRPLSFSLCAAQEDCVNTMGDMSREGATVAGMHCGEMTCSQQRQTQKAGLRSDPLKAETQRLRGLLLKGLTAHREGKC
jgi:hypothetical protein